MKTIVITLASILALFQFAAAQDNIIFKDGMEMQAKVVEISPTELKYKRADHLEGPTYTVYRNEVFMVQYENGSSEVISSIDFTAPTPRLRNSTISTRGDRKLIGSTYKSPGLSFLFSFLMPGGGQYYNKDFGKGGAMTGLWLAGITTAATAPYDYYGDDFYDDGIYYSEYNPNPQRIIGNTVWFGTWLWSIIDAPIRSAAINRKNAANATGLLEFQKQDKWVMKVEPFKSAGLGGAFSMRF